MLHADGTETHLISDVVSGASFSPDGTTVVFAPEFGTPAQLDPGIYLIGADGGAPRLLLAPSRRYSPELDRSIRTELSLPKFSPDGTQIAYIDGNGDWGNSLRIMNADGSNMHAIDGSDVHLLVGTRGLSEATPSASAGPPTARSLPLACDTSTRAASTSSKPTARNSPLRPPLA